MYEHRGGIRVFGVDWSVRCPREDFLRGHQIREDMSVLRNMTYERSDEVECVHVGMDRVEDFERGWIRHSVLESNRWSGYVRI